MKYYIKNTFEPLIFVRQEKSLADVEADACRVVLVHAPCFVKVFRIILRMQFDADEVPALHLLVDAMGKDARHAGGTAESLVLLYGNASAILAVVDDDIARGFVLHVHLHEVLLHGFLPVVGNAHHDDVLVLRQMVHLMLVHLLVFAFAQYKIDAPVRLEESSENLLSLVLVFCGEHVLQIVFQVVLRELCHDTDFLS